MPPFGRKQMDILALIGLIILAFVVDSMSDDIKRLKRLVLELAKREEERSSRGPGSIKDPFGQDWDPTK